MIVNIEGHLGLVRDCSSGAILNTNNTEYENYLVRREKLKQQKLAETEKESRRDTELQDLKAEVQELKQMITGLVNIINKQ